MTAKYWLHKRPYSVIGLNPYCYTSPDGKITNKRMKRFILADSSMSFPDELAYEYFTMNLIMGSIVINDIDGQVAYFDRYDDRIEFFDGSLTPVMTVSGPADITNELSVNDNIVVYKDVKYAYTYAIPWNNSIYASFENGEKQYLLHIGWDGNILKCYRIADSHVLSLSLSEEGKDIFALQENRSGDKYLIRYRL